MTREEAIDVVESFRNVVARMENTEYTVEALDMAITALRPVSREQVEKAWFREPYTRLETRSTPEGNRQYIAENTCMACGSKTPIGHFCHNCGATLDHMAVEMVMERLEALYGQENT